MLHDSNASVTPDLLVIDIDGNDYWIWESVASRHRPRVVVDEHNATMGPRRHWVMPYNANHRWDETCGHGASLTALAALGSRLGYTLIGCDSQGVNAFFVVSRPSAPALPAARSANAGADEEESEANDGQDDGDDSYMAQSRHEARRGLVLLVLLLCLTRDRRAG